MNAAYFVYAGLCLIGLGTRSAYEILKKDGRIDTRNPVIFAVVFVGMALLLGSWTLMGPIDPWRVDVPGAIRGIGLLALILGLGLAIAGLVQLRGLENIDHLVTNGLFAKIRHPMYTGFVLWIAGWIILHGALMSLLVGILCIGNILYWRRLEEDKLVALYGNTYKEYRQRTWL